MWSARRFPSCSAGFHWCQHGTTADPPVCRDAKQILRKGSCCTVSFQTPFPMLLGSHPKSPEWCHRMPCLEGSTYVAFLHGIPTLPSQVAQMLSSHSAQQQPGKLSVFGPSPFCAINTKVWHSEVPDPSVTGNCKTQAIRSYRYQHIDVSMCKMSYFIYFIEQAPFFLYAVQVRMRLVQQRRCRGHGSSCEGKAPSLQGKGLVCFGSLCWFMFAGALPLTLVARFI